MGKQKSRAHRTSSGKRASMNAAKTARKQEKFKAKREAGKAYEYKPNPFEKDTAKYEKEAAVRAEKMRSKKPQTAFLTSVFRKLDNAIEQEKLKAKDTKSKPKK